MGSPVSGGKNGRPEGKPSWDYDALHYMLWKNRTSGDQIRVNLNRWAVIYGIRKEAVFQVLGRMIDQGRIEKTGHRGVYKVNPPT